MFNPSVSVVVNTYNRASSLNNTLIGLSHLQYAPYEIIVVNGPSNDLTHLILEKWQDGIKIAECAEPNLSISRNIGISRASGDIVAFIDDDAIPHPRWIEKLVPKYADELVGGVGGYTVDNTGVRFQACKTVADRYGNAFYPSPFFDERPLNHVGAPIFPTLLGTNSSFRRSVLHEIGGFDHAYAYFLDETDVCLRIVDSGYQVHYEQSALVFHQFAASHVRSQERIAKTLFPSATSKAYFIIRHGARQSPAKAGLQLEQYRISTLNSNQGLADNGFITQHHRASLDQDLIAGIQIGSQMGYQAFSAKVGDLAISSTDEPFKPHLTGNRLRVALISQDFNPTSDAGIGRWTRLLARGLADRGHIVHVISRASEEAATHFEDGFWHHSRPDDVMFCDDLTADHNVPLPIAARASAVRSALQYVKTFGLDLVSFPIWDIEGLACVSDPDLAVVMSLHTSYSLAKPHKKEWNLRPLHEHFSINKVIAVENKLLGEVPTILANSKAIIDDLTEVSGVHFADRAILVPHGTEDPFLISPERRVSRDSAANPFRILFVGRFEMRKGFDLVAKVCSHIIQTGANVEIDLVGEELSSANINWLSQVNAEGITDDSRVRFRGVISRTALNDLYSAAHVVLMPSRYESFGLVAIEAMAAGAPVIALDVGGLSEIVVHDVSGYVVPTDGNEVSSIQHHLRAMIRNENLREQLSAGARNLYESHYTLDKMIDGIEAAYWAAHQKRKVPNAT